MSGYNNEPYDSDTDPAGPANRVRISIPEVVNQDDMPDLLRDIAQQIENGHTEGYHPRWVLGLDIPVPEHVDRVSPQTMIGRRPTSVEVNPDGLPYL